MRRFGELEAVVMDHLWAADGPLNVRDMLDLVNTRRKAPLAYTSVMTVLDNLHRKGAAVREKDGRAWSYRPTQTRQAYAADLMQDALVTSQDLTGTLSAFISQLSAEQAGQLAEAWKNHGGAGPKRAAAPSRRK